MVRSIGVAVSSREMSRDDVVLMVSRERESESAVVSRNLILDVASSC